MHMALSDRFWYETMNYFLTQISLVTLRITIPYGMAYPEEREEFL